MPPQKQSVRKKTKIMKFYEAYAEMVKGKKISRPAFKGYWFINPETGKFSIHLGNGKNITYGQLELMVKNCLAEDWYVYEERDTKTEDKPE